MDKLIKERTGEDVQHFTRRRTDRGAYKAIPFAAIISAASLAWYISVSWVNFRDTVFNHYHDVELRVTSLESHRDAHDAMDAERYIRFSELERYIRGMPKADQYGQDNEQLNRRLDKLETAIDRLGSN